MGYYSEIGLCLNKEANAKMFAELEKQSPAVKSEVQELLNNAQKEVANKDAENESYLYHWFWVKWYSNFPCVGFIEQFLGNLGDDEDSKLQYLLLNIGEHLDDVTERGNFYDNPFGLEIIRSINYATSNTDI